MMQCERAGMQELPGLKVDGALAGEWNSLFVIHIRVIMHMVFVDRI
jgi:hypothetical protein